MVDLHEKILVVDDEAQNVELLQALLTPRGYDIVTASNGEEALQQVQHERPDLILLDVMMPVMDGFAACKKLKQNPETLIIPVIMITALDRAEDRIKGIEAGAESFLNKPVRSDELLVQIRASLLKKQAIEHQMRGREMSPPLADTPAMAQKVSPPPPAFLEDGQPPAELIAAPLFEGCDPAVVADVLKRMQPRRFEADEFLCRQGEMGDSLFLITQGAVEVSVEYPAGNMLVNRLGRGDVVCEVALVTGHVRTANVTSFEPTDVLELSQEDFLTVVQQYPVILDNVGRLSAERLQLGASTSTTRQQQRLGRSVFISYASGDRQAAESVCQILEARGMECWIAPRDVLPGARYGVAIMQAIENCMAMVLMFSASSNSSVHVMNEVERAVNHEKPIFPIRIENTEPSSELAYFISRLQWLDASNTSLESVVEWLIVALRPLHSKSAQRVHAPAVLQGSGTVLTAHAPEKMQEVLDKAPAPPEPADQTPSVPQTGNSVPEWEPDMLRMAEACLITYLGPVAKILVRKESAKARTPEEFFQLLAAHIPIEQEKNQFLQEVILSANGQDQT